MASEILNHFDSKRFPIGPKREAASKVEAVAVSLDGTLPDGAEKAVTLRKLLEAQDAAARSAPLQTVLKPY